MNKFVSVLFKVLGIIFLMATFVGFYLMIQNIGKNNMMSLIWMGVFLGGCLGFALMAVIIIRKQKKEQNKDK
jgi:membrane-bound ClpP family serine protease